MKQRKTEHPALFNGEMVRAILEGRKTQTRRVCKHQPHKAMTDAEACEFMRIMTTETCAGKSKWLPGDTLWVRETWEPIIGLHGKVVRYDADDYYRNIHHESPSKLARAKRANRPNIHMPRWASRITLRVEDVRVERVRDISEEDAMAEGVDTWFPIGNPDVAVFKNYGKGLKLNTAKDSFRTLWDILHAERGLGWDANPFVWVVTFSVKEVRK